MNYDVVIVGNGILGTTLAYLLSKEKLSVALVGPKDRHGSASLAAAAMLNVFAEIDGHSLKTYPARYKLDLAVRATKMWEEHLADLNQHSQTWLAAKIKYGTHIIFNRCSHDMERYNQIKNALNIYEEHYKEDVPLSGYNPEHENKAYKSIYLPFEGFINPIKLMYVLDKGIEVGKVTVINESPLRIDGLTVKFMREGSVTGGTVVIAAGAYSEGILRNGFHKYGIQDMFYGSGTGFLLHPACTSKEEVQEEAIRTPVRAMSCGLFAVPQYNGGLYIGASNHVRRSPLTQPKTSSVMALLNQACAQINKNLVNSSFIKTTLGHRPYTADGFPLVGKVYDNLYLLTGTKRDGLHMSPLYARDMVNRIMGREPLIDDIFNPLRKPIETFSIQESIEDYASAKCNYLYIHGTRMPEADWTRVKKNYREEALAKYDRLMQHHKVTYGLDPGVLEAW
jgi:glycine oxidase